MLFFISAKAKDNPGISPAEFRELASQQLAFTLKAQDAGTVVYNANIAGVKGAIFIVEVPSHEALEQFIFSWPLFNFVNVEILPLVKPDARATAIRQFPQESK